MNYTRFLRAPDRSGKPIVAIVGAGVTGLTSAFILIRKGWDVILFSNHPIEQTASHAAAAFWLQFACGSDPRVSNLAATSLRRFAEFAEEKTPGVFPARLRATYTTTLGQDLSWLSAVPYRSVPKRLLPAGTTAGFDAEVFRIEMEQYLPWLKEKTLGSGAKLVQEKVSLADLANYDLVINATGVYARQFANDEQVRPIRGQVVLVETPQTLLRPGRRDYDILIAEGPTTSGQERCDYIVYRSGDTLLGGTLDFDDWFLGPREDQTESICNRCAEIEPKLKGARVNGTKVGLRPFRPMLRIELETIQGMPPVLHCYGAGGAGVTLSWGVAEDVAALAEAWWIERQPGLKKAA